MPFNFHLHFWKPHSSDRAPGITAEASHCSRRTSTTSVTLFPRNVLLATRLWLMPKRKRERERHPPPTPASSSPIYCESCTALDHSQASVSFLADIGYFPVPYANNKPPSGGFITWLGGMSVSKDYVLPTWHGKHALAPVIRKWWELFPSV